MTPASRKIRLLMALRRGGVIDTRVLAAIELVPREVFVPEPFRDQTYEDVTLPIGCHQTMSQPVVAARMTQALEVGERMKVLEIGTGSGYQTAVLAALCRRVYTIERHRRLLEEAERHIAALQITNVTAAVGDGMLGWPEQAPFDRIMVTAAAAEVPRTLAGQLSVGGIMVVPVGAIDGDQRLLRVRRADAGVETEDLGAVRFVPVVAGVAGE